MRRPLTAVLGTVFLLALAVPANAVEIHRHLYKPLPDGGKIVTAEIVYSVAPSDRDDDGCPDARDHYRGPGCNPPAPTLTAAVTPYVASTPAYPSVPSSSGGCPSYMAGEASSPTAVNPSSGASGCYQVLPSTAAAMGSACSDVNSSSCVTAICAAQGNGAWASSGATPCG